MLIWEQEDTNITPPDETLPPGGLTQKLLYWNPVTSKWEPIGIGAGLQVVNGELVATGGNSGGNNPITLTWASNGDFNGLIYHLGTSNGTQTFSNPVPAKILGLMSSNIVDSFPTLTGYTIGQTTNRSDGLPAHTDNISNSWIGFRLPLNKKMTINKHVIKSRADDNSQHPVSLVLEGSNNIAVDTVAGWNAATWSSIDTLTGLSFTLNEYKDFTCSGAAYNAWRYKQTAVNSNNANYLIIGEVEFYGTYQP